jgi:hypothetical protein
MIDSNGMNLYTCKYKSKILGEFMTFEKNRNLFVFFLILSNIT